MFLISEFYLSVFGILISWMSKKMPDTFYGTPGIYVWMDDLSFQKPIVYPRLLLIIVYLFAQYELSCNLIGSSDIYYQRILPFHSVMLHSQGR